MFGVGSKLPTVSIRSPRRNEGRLRCLDRFPLARPVSIRSPRRNEGRLVGILPLVEKGLVSIRSPRRNEGRRWLL